MDIKHEKDLGNGKKAVTFNQSPKMSTYVKPPSPCSGIVGLTKRGSFWLSLLVTSNMLRITTSVFLSEYTLPRAMNSRVCFPPSLPQELSNSTKRPSILRTLCQRWTWLRFRTFQLVPWRTGDWLHIGSLIYSTMRELPHLTGNRGLRKSCNTS